MKHHQKKFLVHHGSSEHVDEIMEHPMKPVRYEVSRNPNASGQQLSKLLGDIPRTTPISLIQHPNLPKERLDDIISSPHSNVRLYAAGNPSITKDQMDKLSDDANSGVRNSVIWSDYVSRDHLMKLKDSDPDERNRDDATLRLKINLKKKNS